MEEQQNESVDIVRCYLIIASILCIIASFCIGYFYWMYQKASKDMINDQRDLAYVKEHKNEIPDPAEFEAKNFTISNVHEFFRNNRGPSPELDETSWEPQTVDDIEFLEKTYTLTFSKGIRRSDLLSYIIGIYRKNKNIKLKTVELKQQPQTQGYDDQWEATISFGIRKIKE